MIFASSGGLVVADEVTMTHSEDVVKSGEGTTSPLRAELGLLSVSGAEG